MKYGNEWVKKEFKKRNRLKFLFFWGHRPLENGKVGKSCFSQWFVQSFENDGIEYKTAEHWMMAEKARLFNDKEIEQRIVYSETAAEAKKLGREVKGFDSAIWDANKYEIVKKGNYLKFNQNTKLKYFLLSTYERILVEASPYDEVWGIGMMASDSGVEQPNNWKGENLLGYALMEVRDLLKEEVQ